MTPHGHWGKLQGKAVESECTVLGEPEHDFSFGISMFQKFGKTAERPRHSGCRSCSNMQIKRSTTRKLSWRRPACDPCTESLGVWVNLSNFSNLWGDTLVDHLKYPSHARNCGLLPWLGIRRCWESQWAHKMWSWTTSSDTAWVPSSRFSNRCVVSDHIWSALRWWATGLPP